MNLWRDKRKGGCMIGFRFRAKPILRDEQGRSWMVRRHTEPWIEIEAADQDSFGIPDLYAVQRSMATDVDLLAMLLGSIEAGTQK